jgi:hypothetical protein
MAHTFDQQESYIKSRVIVDSNGCWVWQRCIDNNGYAMASVGGATCRIHRLSYELFVGQIPKGMHIDHLCRVRGCVNPQHLEVVTPRENILRGVGISAQHAAQTECKNGHPFTEDNLVNTSSGKRRCKACSRVYCQEQRKRRKIRGSYL